MEEPGVISCEVLKKPASDHYFAETLRPTLRHDSLEKVDEEVLNFRFSELSCNLHEDISHLHIPVHVANGIMHPPSWHILLRCHVGVEVFLALGETVEDEVSSIQRINYRFSLGGFDDLPIEDIADGVRVGGGDLSWVQGGPLRDLREAVGLPE